MLFVHNSFNIEVLNECYKVTKHSFVNHCNKGCQATQVEQKPVNLAITHEDLIIAKDTICEN